MKDYNYKGSNTTVRIGIELLGLPEPQKESAGKNYLVSRRNSNGMNIYLSDWLRYINHLDCFYNYLMLILLLYVILALIKKQKIH